jgi:hypothetical protein
MRKKIIEVMKAQMLHEYKPYSNVPRGTYVFCISQTGNTF